MNYESIRKESYHVTGRGGPQVYFLPGMKSTYK
jgi:hypothetical protein